MFINHANRILLNEADASPGGGAVVASPAEPPAVPAASAPAPVSLDQVKGLIAETLSGFKNEFFASARKAGVLGKDKPAEPSVQSTAPAQQSTPPGMISLSDVEAIVEQERVLSRVQFEHKLTDPQLRRMKSALKAERPDDISAWTDTYLADMGFGKQPETQTTVPVPQPAPVAAPISDKGSPAPGSGTNWHREFADNPLRMSKAAIAAMDSELGLEVARKRRVEAALLRGSQIKVTTR